MNHSYARGRRAALLAAATALAAPPALAQEGGERIRRRAAAPAAAPGERPPGELTPFIDAHVHLNDEAMQLELMQRHGATRAVVFWGRNGDNDTILAAATRHPDRFIPFACVSPLRRADRRQWDADDPAVASGLDALLATGRFKGIGEVSAVHFPSPGLPETDYDPMGPTMRGIMEVARRHRVPVMVHIEVTRLREMQALIEAYRDVPVIWAHGGYTPLFLAARLLGQHPNLTYELSARTWPRHPRSPDYTILRDGIAVWPEWLRLIEEQPGRFIIGTDASHRTLASDTMKYDSVQNVLRQLTPAVRERVARTNMEALL
ncbi:hypothetical protein EOD42_09745 [Rhodovarius crocodyli]|uniref:Amidohydrolase-related domain-containing protein n=1 Tax=Rhodovarius crocodyli TaxID=1979269 RepID=A0A437MGA0_9PROT|nr:TatD family hydrolase [Rhodovarius crocodyli]RVT96688.1 hypothetical protein EOD42_09745 [Rhodovarius crocodyli]